MFHPPKVTNGAHIPIRQVVLHKNQPSNLLWPPDPVIFLILTFWPSGSPTMGEVGGGGWGVGGGVKSPVSIMSHMQKRARGSR